MGLAGLLGYFIYQQIGSGLITVITKPSDVTVRLDGKNISNTKDVRVTPGDHTVQVSADGFKAVDKTITMGWQDNQTINIVLNPKDFKDIFQPLSPDLSNNNYTVAQAKFFANNTWAAAYIVPDDESSDITIAVLQRKNGTWRLIYHYAHTDPEAAKLMPTEVFDYINRGQSNAE